MTGLYEGELSPGADRLSRLISAATPVPFLSAMMFVLLGLGAEDAFVPVVIFLLTATVIPVAVVHHHSVKFGNTDGDAVRRERTVPDLRRRDTLIHPRHGAAFGRRRPAHHDRYDAQLRDQHRACRAHKHKVEDHYPCDRRDGSLHAPVAGVLAMGDGGVPASPAGDMEPLRQAQAHPRQLVGGAVCGFVATGLILWLFL